MGYDILERGYRYVIFNRGNRSKYFFFSINEKFISYTNDPLIRFSSGEMTIIYNRISIIYKECFMTGHNF